MSNINFTNPYLLFVGLGLIIVFVVSFFIFIKKQGFNFHSITSLVLHIVICALVGLALAQMTYSLVITETNVYVLADVSYSANANLDKIDGYINDLENNLPKNSKLGIVCYAKDYDLLVKAGDKIKSVKKANVDASETNIKPALEYVSSLFDESAIKRIVIISDGKETNKANLSGVVSDYSSQGIHIDAIYVDSNIDENTKEIQISNVEYDSSAYKGDSSTAVVTVDSNQDVEAAYLRLYYNDSLQEEMFLQKLTKGSNMFSFNLNTDEAGTVNYRVELAEYKNDEYNEVNDTNSYNNTYLFNQVVSDKLRILFISNSFDLNSVEKYNDKEQFEKIYSDEAKYDVDYYTDTINVPYNLDDFCKYDEIVLSNVDARKFNNAAFFMANLDKAVSEYGKSLVTIGNTYVQDKLKSETDGQKEVLNNLEMMLPIKYSSDDSNRRLFTIVMDTSKSLMQAGGFELAKKAACSIIDDLTSNTDLYIVGFYGNVYTIYNINPGIEANKEYAKELINKLEGKQSTSLGAALQHTYDNISTKTSYVQKQVFVISDGNIYGGDSTNIENLAKKFKDSSIYVSSVYIQVGSVETEGKKNLTSLSNTGGGYFYEIKTSLDPNLTLSEIGNIVRDSYKTSKDGYVVTKAKPKNDVLDGVINIENVSDFYVGDSKTTATTVLEVNEGENKFPLYSTWRYGEGKVSSLATSLKHWSENSGGYTFSSNVVGTNTPSNLNRTPYIVELSKNGSNGNITVSTNTINLKAKATVKITYPSGNVVENNMSFDSVNYISSYKLNEIGTYKIEFTYDLGNLHDTVTKYDTLSYFPEYDSFESFDSSNLYTYITSDGTVSEDGKLTISNEGLQMTTYKYDFTPILMIIICVLFVVDIAIRKLRWQDIKDIFSKKKKKVDV